jgi:hypothetical protein
VGFIHIVVASDDRENEIYDKKKKNEKVNTLCIKSVIYKDYII